MSDGSAPRIEVNMDKLTIGDLELLERFQEKKQTTKDLLDFLDRVVVGGARHLPLASMKDIMSAIQAEVDDLANPEDAEGKP